MSARCKHPYHRLMAAFFAVFAVAGIVGTAGSAAAQLRADQLVTTQSREAGLVFHHLARYRPSVARLEKQAPALVRRAAAGVGLPKLPVVDVWLLPTVRDYFDIHDAAAGAPRWAVGLSLAGRHEIIVAHGAQRQPDQVMRTFAHELAHVAVDQARGDNAVPRWFQEGFAVLMAHQWGPQRVEQLAHAASGGGLASFDDLARGFPSHHQSASLAYDQSFHFVRWLRQQYGRDLFGRVLQQISESGGFQGALEDQTGTPFDQLQVRWRQSLTNSTTIWSILRDDTTLFFGVGVLLIIACVVMRRRRRRQLESMEDAEGDGWDYDPARYPLPGQTDPDGPPSG